jgi:proteasome lid subunit RPN8/RPN11
MQAIRDQAAEEYPAECCGILTAATAEAASDVHRCRNIQDQLHAKDPEQYPRDSRIAYFIDPGELFQIVSGAEKAGGLVTGFYHSHIDCDAYFSEEDKERAMAWDEPAYPDAVYLVISVYGSEVRGHRAFTWDADRNDFVEVEIEAD